MRRCLLCALCRSACTPHDRLVRKASANMPSVLPSADLPGFTRSVYERDHALVTPESRVFAPGPAGWCAPFLSFHYVRFFYVFAAPPVLARDADNSLWRVACACAGRRSLWCVLPQHL